MVALALAAALAVTGAAAAPPAYAGPGVPSGAQEPNVNTATVPSAVAAAAATATASHKSGDKHGASFSRFVTIWLENTDYDKAASDPNLAWLASKGITLTNYFGVTHPSEPNYVSAIGGDNFGMDNDNFNQIEGNVSTVIDLLEAKGITWGSYQEHMPYTGYEGMAWVNQSTKANDYVRKHNPPVLYDANTTPDRLINQKNFTLFAQDVANKKLPQWSFITPNMTNDGHDTSVTVAGTWARSFLEPLLENKYFTKNTLILLTFDENHTYNTANRVFSILLGDVVEGKEGTVDSNYYNHYSEISSVEANWGLDTLGRWDVGANVFEVVAEQTGDKLVPNPAVTADTPTQFQNSSFAGPFNTGFAQAGYPIPNTTAVSPNGKRHVAQFIVDQYSHMQGSTYYNSGVVIPDGQHPPAGYAVNHA